MSSAPQPAVPERCGIEYLAALAQMWAAVEPRQQWIDQEEVRPRNIDDLVDEFLLANDPYPVSTPIFAARWKPGQWGLAHVIRRTDLDEWAVVFLDSSGQVSRDHIELCPAF